ncbi:MAG: peptide chain release factor family protein [Planctomycetaceae bacterium]
MRPLGIRRDEVRVEFLKASGPGGQHRNKTESGVRLTHLPTGVAVRAVERRSQAQNLSVAWERLAERLRRLRTPKKPRRKTRPTRGSVERRLAAKAARGARKRERGLGREP